MKRFDYEVAINQLKLGKDNPINTNIKYDENLLDGLKRSVEDTAKGIIKGSYWDKEVKKMKFDAVVGNPPYQLEIDNRSEQPPIYHLFYDTAFALSKKSLTSFSVYNINTTESDSVV